MNWSAQIFAEPGSEMHHQGPVIITINLVVMTSFFMMLY